MARTLQTDLGLELRGIDQAEPGFVGQGDDALLEPGMRKSVTHLRSFAANPVAKPVTIDFDFFAMPVALEGEGRVQRVIVERTELAISVDGRDWVEVGVIEGARSDVDIRPFAKKCERYGFVRLRNAGKACGGNHATFAIQLCG